jgi:adenylosuccinate lyase
MAQEFSALPMLSRTHGQTASPTTLGKEVAVFGYRLAKLRKTLANCQQLGKINGAVGAYNAHTVAFPEVDWQQVSRSFVEEKLGLKWNPLTTQIENHDAIAEFADTVRRAQVIMIGLCRDMWSYISIGYFKQRTVAGEVGSSTMPHKVNPIDFENAEGNFGISNSLAAHFTEKLLISRWQRDLSDSTVLRTIGTLSGHAELATTSLLRGLNKLEADPDRIAADLDNAWEVLGEAIQTVMRRYGVSDAYERLKSATRGQAVTKEALHQLIDATTELPEEQRERLKALTPATYTGLAAELVDHFLQERNL